MKWHLASSFLFVCSVCATLAAEAPKGLLNAPLLDLKDIRPTSLRLDTAADGTQYIAMRLRLDDAPAVRVHISDMRLVAGQRLIVSNADGTQVFGPYEISGPTNSGEFWTDAVQGSDIIIELQTGSEGAADLPFRVDAIEAAEPAEAIQPISQEPTEVKESWYNGIPVSHAVVDGMAVYEGDILLGPANELPQAQPGSAKNKDRSAVAVTGQFYRWPNATIPYVIASTVPNQARITGAVDHWNKVMAGVVRLVPRTDESVYVQFVRPTSAGTCTSYIGKVFSSGAQPIQTGDYCSLGNIIHEIGHAFGLWHEHTREDRNNHVTVNLENVQTGQTHNFTQNISTGDDIGVYDYASIMHYNTTAFSANGLPTIVTIPAGIPIGQRNGLSTGDIAAIKILYPPPVVVDPVTSPVVAPVNVTVNITANPQGSPITVDGVVYAAPRSFTWAEGSSHTINAPDSTSDGTRVSFVKWSDDGAQSHTITASSAVTTYKVDYAVEYSVQATPAAPVGNVNVAPASADGFYANGTPVTLSATASNGYCFTGWTGLITGTPSTTSVTATKPYSVVANFQTGTVSLPFGSFALPRKGGTLTLSVSANAGCMWKAAASDSWITIKSGATGTGAGPLTITLPVNNTGVARVGSITVGNYVMTVTQGSK
jgi:hypothetical protein